jgi:hypothetical protein
MQQNGGPRRPLLVFMGGITQGGALDYLLIATGLVYEARDEVKRYLLWTKTKGLWQTWERIVLP